MRDFLCIALALIWAASASSAEPAARNLSDPSWWVTQARAELKLIADAQEQTLIGSMVSSAQGQLAPPEELAKALEERFAPQRAQFGDDADWQFALYAARQYLSANRFREALESIRGGRKAIEAIGDAARRSRIHQEFDSEQSSIASAAISAQEIVQALEAASGFHRPSYREEALNKIASAEAKVDLATAEKSSPQITAATPLEWRLLLLIHCRGGQAADYERAIRQLLDDRPHMDAADVRRCYRALARTVQTLPDRFNPQVLTSLENQLSLDMAPGAKENERDAASECRATLLIVQERLDEAHRVADARGQPILRGSFREKAAQLLVAQGKHELAADLSPIGLTDAHAMTKAGKLDEALDAIARFPDRGAGNAGYAAAVAEEFARRDDWRGVERALALLEDEHSWAYCLATVAKIADRAGRRDRVAALLAQGSRRVASVKNADARAQAAQSLALAHVAVGDAATAWNIVDRLGADFERAMVLTKTAERQLQRKDIAAFQASMSRLLGVLARDQLDTSPDASLPAESSWRGPRQIFFTLMAGRLFLRAGDRAKAESAIKDGFARTGNVPGTVWRADVYFAEPFLEEPQSQDLGEIADLMHLVPTHQDKAILALLGGLLAEQQGKAQPAAGAKE